MQQADFNDLPDVIVGQAVCHHSSVFLGLDNRCIFQDAQLMGNGGGRHSKRFCNLPDFAWAALKEMDNPHFCWIAKKFEHLSELGQCRGIVLKYHASTSD